MLTKRLTGILGILIPILCFIAFAIFHIIINPEYQQSSEFRSLVIYNFEHTEDGFDYSVKGAYWVKGVIYLGVGQLISIFSLGLFIHSRDSITNKAASILLLITGIIWLSFGVWGYGDPSSTAVLFLIARMILCFLFAVIGFLLICNDIHKIIPNKKVKWFLITSSILLLVNGFIEALLRANNSGITEYIAWSIYFITFGILGFFLFKSSMNYKLICTDIDGTLLNADRYLSDATVSAFAKANTPTVLASSRMPSAMHYLQEGLNIKSAPLIAYNGGLILGRNGTCIESNTMPLDVLKDLLKHHKDHSYNLSIYADDDWFTDQEDFWSLREINNTRVTPTYQKGVESLSLLQSEQRAPHKLMCMGEASEIDSIVNYLSDRHHTDVHLYRSKDTYLEITPKYIDKAKALQILLNNSFEFGMDKVIAFGDNHNDEELLKHAGFGVAVANATDKLKAIANYTSAFTNKEDAVAKAIEQFVIRK